MTSIFVAAAMAALIDLGDTSIYRRMRLDRDGRALRGGAQSDFSLHAAVRCGADQRKALEHLCRYITRPAIANERLKCNRAGQVVLQLNSAYQDCTTPIVISPRSFSAGVVPPATIARPAYLSIGGGGRWGQASILFC